MANKARFQASIKDAKNIVITTHTFPDADGLGAQIALTLCLRKLGKWCLAVNQKPLLDRYHYLDTESLIIGAKEFAKHAGKREIDLLIVTDANSLSRIGPEVEKAIGPVKSVLFVDHHPCPKEISAIHCIDVERAATSELVADLIESVGVTIDQSMALPLYTGILIDTSSFRYPTVTYKTHAIVAKLMATGITPALAYNMIYGTKKVGHVQLVGKILSETRTNKDGSIAWIYLKEKDLKDHKVDPEDTHAFINNLLILDGLKIACMFRELENNQIKLSLRSTDPSIDAGAMAQALGGGGHNHSAASILEGKADLVIKQVVEKLELMMKST